MARKLKIFRGIAEPVLSSEPLLIRACSAFVNSITLILKTAFIVGAIYLAEDFREFTEELRQPVHEIEPALAMHEPEKKFAVKPERQEPVLSERVKHYLNCTYEDYRAAHYDECIEEPSYIYLGPQAEPDDMGNIPYDMALQLARLDDYTGFE